MADSVVHVEIEDVLESVRRLVTEDNSVSTAPADSADQCFVLTPAHLVADQNEESAIQSSVETATEVDDEPSESDELADMLSEVSEQTEDAGETFAPASDMSNDEASLGPDLAGDHTQMPVNFSASEYQSMAEAWKSELTSMKKEGSSIVPDGHSMDEPEGTTLEQRIAELEAAVARSREDWEPDGSEPSKKPEIKRHLFEVVDNTIDEMTGAETKPSVAVENVTNPSDSADTSIDRVYGIPTMPPMRQKRPDSDVFVLAERIADPIAKQAEVFGVEHAKSADTTHEGARIPAEHAGLEQSGAAVFSHTRPGNIEPLVLVPSLAVDEEPEEMDIDDTADPAVSSEIKRQEKNAEIVQEDDVFLDVEALRTMIGELVREELRGKMGERITHNVRQMVRQEIERALLRLED